MPGVDDALLVKIELDGGEGGGGGAVVLATGIIDDRAAELRGPRQVKSEELPVTLG